MSDVTPIPDSTFDDLATIGLEELNSKASLQIRHDRKYLIPVALLSGFIKQATGILSLLEIDGTRSFRYESVYFDTSDLHTYFAAAQRKPLRWKVRTRTYLDSDRCSLEVKTRDRRGKTNKDRFEYFSEYSEKLTEEGSDFVQEILGSRLGTKFLSPTLRTSYSRSTLLIAASNSRVTIDSNLQWNLVNGNSISLPDYVLIETKTIGGPTSIDRLLWANHTRPTKISKYCTGLAALKPELAANKWNRVLRKRFDWAPRRS